MFFYHQFCVLCSVDLTIEDITQLRKELLPVDGAVRVVEEIFGEMTEGHTLMSDIASEFNLDAEKLRRRFDEAMAGPTAVEREPFRTLADQFSGEPLST